MRLSRMRLNIEVPPRPVNPQAAGPTAQDPNSGGTRVLAFSPHGRGLCRVTEREREIDESTLYDSLESALSALGVGIGACECHGTLIGMLVTTPWGDEGLPRSLTDIRWVEVVLEDAATGLEPDIRADWGVGILHETWNQAVQSLGSDGFAFEPLLPPDDRPVGARARGLGEWCAGFLSGLGQGGGLGQTLSDEVREVIRDFTEITRIEPNPEAGEASEQALTEVVEFVRAGVLLIDAELGLVVRASSSDEAPLH